MTALIGHTVERYEDLIGGEVRRMEKWTIEVGDQPTVVELSRVQRELDQQPDEDWIVLTSGTRGWTDCPHDLQLTFLVMDDHVPGEICDAVEQLTDISMAAARPK